MAIQHIFDTASSVMTVVSFITFVAVLWWAFTPANRGSFEQAASLPFADEADAGEEGGHV
ncbi:MAG: cbb3-type cytochrome oxidase subunit 3 [Telluria sp.]